MGLKGVELRVMGKGVELRVKGEIGCWSVFVRVYKGEIY